MALSTSAGCATYVDHLRQANYDASSGNYSAAVAEMNRLLGVGNGEELPNTWSGDKPLAALERGSLQQALAQFTDSARSLSGAEQQLELLDLKTDPVGALGSYIYSDSVKTYKTPPTERLSLNAINLLNYVAQGNFDGAAVEARRFQVMRDYLDSLNIKAEGPATLGTYLSGFVFEQRGEGDRALRYYEETLSANSQLQSLDAPIAKLARSNPYRGPQLNQVLARTKGTTPGTSPSELLVVMSAGRVPHREPARIPVGAAISIAGSLYTGNPDWIVHGVAKVVVYPELVDTPSILGPAQVSVDGQPVNVEELTDLGASITREYQDMKPKIIAAALTRMAARAGVAEGVRQAAKKQSNALGDVLAVLFESTMVALDKPDTRSWTMLPNRVFVARMPITPGQHDVDVSFGQIAGRAATVEIPEGGSAVVVVTEPR